MNNPNFAKGKWNYSMSKLYIEIKEKYFTEIQRLGWVLPNGNFGLYNVIPVDLNYAVILVHFYAIGLLKVSFFTSLKNSLNIDLIA